MIPEFIQEVYMMEDEELKNLGTFHLGQIYDLTFFVGKDRSMAVFPCQEILDEESKEISVRSLVVT